MELALVLSSLAGAATAATISKFPKGKNKIPLMGANSQIRSQIDALRIEKEILQKTISRLYGEPTTLTKVQVDKLLSRYQYQLGVILAKIEKLEEASKYPDLGPLGDGLMTLMDQKLSALDKRLADISSKIQVAQTVQIKPEIKEIKKEEAKIEKPIVETKPEITTTQNIEELIKSFAKPGKRIEFTTLTEIPDVPVPLVEIETRIEQPVDTPEIHVQTMAEIVHAPEIIPVIETKQEIIQQVAETVQPEIIKPVLAEPIDIEQKVKAEPPKLEFKEQEKKKPKVNLPEPEEVEDDEDDLDSIKREIMKTLSKLEQAEVE
ncbi:hypothetical protein [Candidatus Nitrosotenuis aquarius]|uniref:hypothetical protein n=1 Tax=Candidatus Nitrosotenuis aquarius TaxID=1846278 RepID=UPI000C1F3D41|nr:hypothetical protein [Candidatus Nitrosotenuis aquarius]